MTTDDWRQRREEQTWGDDWDIDTTDSDREEPSDEQH